MFVFGSATLHNNEKEARQYLLERYSNNSLFDLELFEVGVEAGAILSNPLWKVFIKDTEEYLEHILDDEELLEDFINNIIDFIDDEITGNDSPEAE